MPGLRIARRQGGVGGTSSTSESVASIGLRTQTIQLLRDAYYRLCEAFLRIRSSPSSR